MKPQNFEIKLREGDSQDKIIKKFLKKTSKMKIVQQCVDKMFFKSESQKSRNKKARKKFIKRKIQESYINSLNEES
jgi:ribosomal protein S21